ncbi:PaaI family thioesterase [Ponticaulis sp.]|uniref:PaaI family thioesterase n=1 Tax=Ponticaulis sp. TaxID=2020902 RepID=UPI000B6DB808|nr:PaaI family thioesterase [Ponticaulis sp.]OUY01711.1 MAG: hypothetical protein CBB65_00930 [Hyphomonadaceae bacterium TMED5]|tara:strand:- start:42355 stop:42792 length:438 start_codon:yes stop_codon:yes gene_type:complete
MEYMVPDAELTAEQFMSRGENRWPGHTGVELTHVARDRFEGGFDVQDFHMAPNGFLHAGTVVTLADTLCGYACVANLPAGASGFTTVELKSNFMSTAREGRVTATALPVHMGKTTEVWDCEVTNANTGKRMALFRCTQMVLYPKG